MKEAPRLNKKHSHELLNISQRILLSPMPNENPVDTHKCTLLNTVCSMIALLLSFMVSTLSMVHSVFDGFKINFKLTLIKRP